MEKFQSLADFLGTAPARSDEPEPRLVDITDSKAFALAVLNSREFRHFIVNGVTLGDLPTPIMLRLMDHAWGKPVDHIEVKDTTEAPETLAPEELEARALRLAEMARSARLPPMPKASKESVH